MLPEEALKRLHEIVAGIDRTEYEGDDGWWETSTGEDFGEERLRLLEALISELAN